MSLSLCKSQPKNISAESASPLPAANHEANFSRGLKLGKK